MRPPDRAASAGFVVPKKARPAARVNNNTPLATPDTSLVQSSAMASEGPAVVDVLAVESLWSLGARCFFLLGVPEPVLVWVEWVRAWGVVTPRAGKRRRIGCVLATAGVACKMWRWVGSKCIAREGAVPQIESILGWVKRKWARGTISVLGDFLQQAINRFATAFAETRLLPK